MTLLTEQWDGVFATPADGGLLGVGQAEDGGPPDRLTELQELCRVSRCVPSSSSDRHVRPQSKHSGSGPEDVVFAGGSLHHFSRIVKACFFVSEFGDGRAELVVQSSRKGETLLE